MSKARTEMPEGFQFSTVEAAIKKPGRKDLALIVSTREASMAGMFTSNRIKAAPVRLDMRRIRTGIGRAIVVNSGNANACNGDRGMKDARETAELVASLLGIDAGEVYVCSTGVIGKPLPMERIRARVPELVHSLGRSDIHDVAAAIMTTDTFPKVLSKKIRIGASTITIAGVCKGAGMICPHMATMLCFLMTDANIGHPALDAALRAAVRSSFNRITVDGDMSTNDTVLIMANGLAGNGPLKEDSPNLRVFTETLTEVATELSRMIVRDGEGATKLVEVEVKGARNDRHAEKAAYAVANSLLVKTALYGNDANWGRIMAAIGRAGIDVREDKTDISIGGVKIVRKGVATGKEEEAAGILRRGMTRITVDLGLGSSSARVVTCDLTEEYVRINAEYRT